MAAPCKGRDVNINILQVPKTTSQKWHGQTIESLIQAALDILENVPDRLIFDKGKALKIFIEERKTRWFWCELRDTYVPPVSSIWVQNIKP